MTNTELRAALAEELGWKNVRVGPNGCVTGTIGRMLTFAPQAVPNWPEQITDALRLLDTMEFLGIRHDYDLRVAGCEDDARAMSEAALTTLAETKNDRVYRLGFLLSGRR